MNYIGFYDGSANPNPGKLGLGVTIYGNEKELVCAAKPAGHGTNNEAEYLALILLLELGIEEGIKTITVYGDSQLITNQVNGKWSVGKDTLVKYHAKAVALSKAFSHIEFKWCKRQNNRRADLLSKRGGELTELKVYRSNAIEKNVSKSVIETSISSEEKTNKIMLPTKVVSISKYRFLITDGNGISKLDTSPSLRCSCKVFYKEGACIHTHSFKKLTVAKAS
jgi:ribonuclease HI